jgi:3-oxoacyl-[acyl-carrier protein] reductase
VGPFDLRERVVIITGAAGGLGRAYAQALGQAGALAVVADLRAEAAQTCADEVTAAGGTALAVEADVSDEDSVAAMAALTLEEFGRIDGLVNNAAVFNELQRRGWEEIPVEEWDHVMAVNVRGMFLACRAVATYMRRQRDGQIVNISSSRVWDGTAGRLHYTTSKAGVIGFTRALARELGADGIRVNAVTPGLTVTHGQQASTDERYLARGIEGRALARAQVPGDVVGTVLFLLAPASAFITGQAINVDGGRTMH